MAWYTDITHKETGTQEELKGSIRGNEAFLILE